jgi:hypothetical protein
MAVVPLASASYATSEVYNQLLLLQERLWWIELKITWITWAPIH